MFVRTHIVQKGDTLWKIAKQYGIGFEELKRLNSHLANPDYIVPGMEIILPDDVPSTKQPTSKGQMMPDKAKTIETPQKAKPVEMPPKAKPVEKEMPKPEKPKEEITQVTPVTPVQPAPQIIPMPQPMPMPIPIPIQQMQPVERPEFHFDFSPQFSLQPPAQPIIPQPTPQPMPMPQPIFIEIPVQQMPQQVKEEKKVEKEVEYVPVPQTHVEYVPVPQPIYIPCIPKEVHPCHPKPHHKPCGCGGDMNQHYDQSFYQPYQGQMMPQWMDCYPQMMPYSHVQSAYDYESFMPSQNMYGGYDADSYMPHDDLYDKKDETTEGSLPDWLFDSTSMDPVSDKDSVKDEHSKDVDKHYMDYNSFEQATSPHHDYYQTQPYGYDTPQSMYQQMHPYMHYGFEPYMQQQYPTHMMNPCAPHFRPWLY